MTTATTAEATATPEEWEAWAVKTVTQINRKAAFYEKKNQRRMQYACDQIAEQLAAHQAGFDAGAEWRLTAPPEQIERLTDLVESLDVRADFDDEYSCIDLACEILGDDADEESATEFWEQFEGVEDLVTYHRFAWGFCEAASAT